MYGTTYGTYVRHVSRLVAHAAPHRRAWGGGETLIALDQQGGTIQLLVTGRPTQVGYVVSTYFRDVEGLLVLEIDLQWVNAEIRDESAGGDERFPHIYGPLNLDAVIETRPVDWGGQVQNTGD